MSLAFDLDMAGAVIEAAAMANVAIAIVRTRRRSFRHGHADRPLQAFYLLTSLTCALFLAGDVVRRDWTGTAAEAFLIVMLLLLWQWIRRRTRQIAPVEPAGVRIVQPDGTTVSCDVLLEPERDKDGDPVWTAVPRTEVVIINGARLAVDYLPPRSTVVWPRLRADR